MNAREQQLQNSTQPTIAGEACVSASPFLNLSLIDMEGEIWKDVIGYSSMYEVSNYGRIKSLLTNRILKQWYCGNKQLMVTLSADGVKSKIYVSQIVGGCFLRFTQKGEVYAHLDSDKTNNRVSNLAIETKRNQTLLSYHNGVMKDWGIKNVGAKTQFIQKRKFVGTSKTGVKTEYTHNELLIKYGSGVRSILRVIEGRKNFNTAYGQTWESVLIF